MTTICYRNGIIAADTLTTMGGIRVGSVSKIGKAGPVIYGGAGLLAEVQNFARWVNSGLEGDPPTIEESTILVALKDEDGKIHVSEYTPKGWVVLKDEYHAVGSGFELALGAMGFGATAIEAVKVAIERDVSSGGDIEYVSLTDE